MVYLLLWAFLSQQDSQHDADDGAAEVAFPRDVLQDGQVGNHAPDEATVKENRNQGNDDEDPVASDEAARDEEKIEAIDERTRPDVDGAWVADAPCEQSAHQVGEKHDAVGEGGVEVVQGRAQDQNRDAVGGKVLPAAVQKRQSEDAE